MNKEYLEIWEKPKGHLIERPVRIVTNCLRIVTRKELILSLFKPTMKPW